MKLSYLIYISGLFAIMLTACKTEDQIESESATVTALTCASVTFSATSTKGTPYTGTASVPYTGGNAVTYFAGNTISSTGVTGLTATLATGTLTGSTGNLSYTITGTPASAGTAAFAINFGGVSCSMSLNVADSATSVVNCSKATTTVAKVVCAVQAFQATLSAAQLATVQLDLNKANAIKWSNLPGGADIRNGLEFSKLSVTQLAAAKAVIAAASGTATDEGYSEFSQINAADNVLNTKAGNGYGSGLYIIAFLGTPSITGTWMLQFGGHHYAQNITYAAGAVVSATPSYQGIEPKTWTTSGTTYAPLKTEHDAMAAMLASLTTTQLTSAKLSTTFSDVLLGPNKDGQFPATKAGIAVNTLTNAQKLLVLAAMKPWTQDVDDATGIAMLKIYENELSGTYIAYSGNAALINHADYVRIDGPSVWIEFVCQSGVVYQNEIRYNSIYRDRTRDYNGL